DPHRAEEFGRRHEDHELQLRLFGPAGNVETIETGPVVPHVDRPPVGGPGRPLQAGDVAYPVLVRAGGRVARALEDVREEGGAAAVGELVGTTHGRRRIRAENVLDALEERPI